ncbi:flagellar hook protein FlgE [Pseudacidovorax sp. RU35E]|uniref:flagellar hook protein FlgE n=1 Tax=Pseudacidovorax sp. RU35E TaxID=1907403 RepID=UPI0009566D81|nr:flagellar hook protein FlgE [Pseudacidovorax sp. RU35E]SIQ14404.1 flagellar hook protein FlgE [Pseudacidovorax sp. RU35E]
MSFQQAIAGLNAASRSLDVIGHNIANAGTTGMKSSRVEFAEVYAAAASGTNSVTGGMGVTVGSVSQQFTQGNINSTGNALDMAINGNGFFQVTMPDGSSAYTRAGNFKKDATGTIVTSSGAKLMGYPTDAKGARTSSTLQTLAVPTGTVPAKQTSAISANLTLDASAAATTSTTDLSKYSTSLTAYDAQGLKTEVGMYFQKTANNTWNVYTSVNGSAPAASTPFQLSFDASGNLTSGGTQTLTLTSPNDPTVTFPVSLDLTKVKQVASNFTVNDLTQDGYTAGQLTSLTIDDSGTLMATYSNNQTQAAGQVAMVDFRNPQGLGITDAGYWFETTASGQPLLGAPGEGIFGSIQSKALEESNVDLTAALVDMMTTQRAYQANAQTIKTQDQVLQTLVNLR